MRKLTLTEVNEQHGGKLPPDATLRPDDDEIAATADAKAADTARRTAAKPKRPTRTGRFAEMNAFVDASIADLTGSEVKVWLILFRDTKSGTGTARTGQADIARRAGLTVRMVQKALAAIKAKGMLETVRRGRLNVGPSTYRVHPTRPS